MTKQWRLPDGRILWVGKAFEAFMTFCSDPHAGGRHRFKSRKLPPRKTIEEAQADLDAWATKGRLVEAKP